MVFNEVFVHEKRYLNEDSSTKMVSFQVDSEDWPLIQESEAWKKIEDLLSGLKNKKEGE